MPVLERLRRCRQVDLDAALLQLFGGPHAERLAHLGKDAAGRLHEHPPDVLRLDVLVVAAGVAGHVLQLGQRLDAREAATDDGEREQPLAQLGVEGARGLVQLREDVVAQVDGLTDGLEGDALLGQSGDRQQSRDGAERHHEHVVVELLDVPVGCLHRDGLVRVLDGVHAGGQNVAASKHPAQRHDHVTWLDGPRSRLRQEGLVGHVWLRVDDGHGSLVGPQLLLQPEGRVQADVSATEDQDPRRFRLDCHDSMVAPLCGRC